jgi:hypothetical protein
MVEMGFEEPADEIEDLMAMGIAASLTFSFDCTGDRDE